MAKMNGLLCLLFLAFASCGTSVGNDQPEKFAATVSADSLSFDSNGGTQNIDITVNGQWAVSADKSWCTVTPAGGIQGNYSLGVKVEANPDSVARTALVNIGNGTEKKTVKILQKGSAGYQLVWSDEFNDGGSSMPSASRWSYETGGGGWGNNELETYVAGKTGDDTLAYVSDGTLKIYAKKINNTVYSIRMNTTQSWTYGYFEARLKLPKGKGTWPAFWMLPQNFTAWPADGEIDIMEEVGYNPNYVASSIHCTAYNHVIGTQKTASKYVENAEGEFHVYAVEWTAQYIKGFVDGVNYFTFYNDGKGNKDTWPFNVPFYLKLNLAWGGNWGGANGVDESALPLTYEIDYVRVYQK